MSCRVISGTQSSLQFPKINTISSTKLSSYNPSFKTHVSNSLISTKISSGSTRIRTNFTIKNSMNTATKSSDTFYEILGIPENVGQLEIKKAYKQLAMKYHPDVSPPEKTEEYTKRFIRVQEAYETLSDPKTRVLYDMDMSQGLNLAFSARKGNRNVVRDSEWTSKWQSQISELNRRSKVKNSRGGNVSWGDRMRKQRNGFE